jgi:Ser/Thr protein kinase RdoA (MazF antagonist)
MGRRCPAREFNPRRPSLPTDSYAMTAEPDFRQVLAAYPDDCQPQRTEFLGAAGGFSGAMFWRLQTPHRLLCLRRWPREHPPTERLEFIQAVLWHVNQEGFRLAPLPLETRTRAGYVRHAEHLWELTPWMPGAANYTTAPSAAKLRAALVALGEFHRAAAAFPLPVSGHVASPGIARRLELLQSLITGEFETIKQAVKRAAAVQAADNAIADGEITVAAQRLLELFPRAAPEVLAMLRQASRIKAPLQPCVCDIWHDHVLFEGEQVSGLIDFGAMRAETVAADVARLLGSLVGDDPAGWKAGLAAYESVRPLSEAEAVLVSALDQSGVLLGGMNWLRWIYVEGRVFEDRSAVLARLTHLGTRLGELVGRIV